jgi:hypothetical protein
VVPFAEIRRVAAPFAEIRRVVAPYAEIRRVVVPSLPVYTVLVLSHLQMFANPSLALFNLRIYIYPRAVENTCYDDNIVYFIVALEITRYLRWVRPILCQKLGSIMGSLRSTCVEFLYFFLDMLSLE